MQKQIHPDFGFESMLPVVETRKGLEEKLEQAGMQAMRRNFSPEFVNRIDAVLTYQPLDAASLAVIVDQQIAELERHIENRLEVRAFGLAIGIEARAWLLKKGTSAEYGARELKRTILRSLTQPLAAMVASGVIEPGAIVRADVVADALLLTVEE